jgi:hypothetical protein
VCCLWLPIGGWALEAETLATVANLVRRERPNAILELGSGTSTVLLAWLLRHLYGDRAQGRLLSLDEDPLRAARTLAALDARGLSAIASVHRIPLGTSPDNQVSCYLPTQPVRRALDASPPQLILADGPSLRSGASRVGAIALARPYLRDRALLRLDDAFRDAELLVAEAWSREPGVSVAGIAVVGRGLLVATVDDGGAEHPSPQPRES